MSRTAPRLRSKVGLVVACLYLSPGVWVIASTYSCRSALCDVGALVYSAVPIPFLKAFYSIIAFIQGVSWWEAPWPLPGAILAGLSLACNSVAIYFTVVLIQGIRRRKRRDPQSP